MMSKVKLQLHITNTVQTATMFVMQYGETFLFTDTSYRQLMLSSSILWQKAPKKDEDARRTCTTLKCLIYLTSIYEF